MTIPKLDSLSNSPMEKWCPVAGYEGCYAVSNYGRVKSITRIDERGRRRAEKIRSQHVSGKYFQVTLYLGDSYKTLLVSRMVALAFVDNPYKKPHVNHIDGNKLNNKSDNLEWVTREENIQHAIRTGLFRLGGRHASSMLTDEQVIELRKRHNNGESRLVLAKEFGVSKSTITGITSGDRWRHLL